MCNDMRSVLWAADQKASDWGHTGFFSHDRLLALPRDGLQLCEAGGARKNTRPHHKKATTEYHQSGSAALQVSALEHQWSDISTHGSLSLTEEHDAESILNTRGHSKQHRISTPQDRWSKTKYRHCMHHSGCAGTPTSRWALKRVKAQNGVKLRLCPHLPVKVVPCLLKMGENGDRTVKLGKLLPCYRVKTAVLHSTAIIIILCIYHALINALSAHIMHINLNINHINLQQEIIIYGNGICNHADWDCLLFLEGKVHCWFSESECTSSLSMLLDDGFICITISVTLGIQDTVIMSVILYLMFF